jgi:ATP-binding cassette subfamily F protein 3
VEEGRVHVYPGNYEDYQFRKNAAVAPDEAEARPKNTDGKPALPGAPRIASEPWESSLPDAAASPTQNPPATARRLNPIKLRQMQDRLQCVEEEIPRSDAAIAATEAAMANYVSAEETQRLAAELARRREENAALAAEWEELMVQLEEQETLSR